MSASADISVKVEDTVDIDAGLDDVNVDVNVTAPIDVGLKDVNVDIQTLPVIRLGNGTSDAGAKPLAAAVAVEITKIPKVQVGLDHIQLGLDPIEVKPLQVNLGPIELNLAIKEIPSVRVHLPAHFGLGLSLFGHEVLSARVAGEAQVITKPYEPNACEHCEGHKKVKAKTP